MNKLNYLKMNMLEDKLISSRRLFGHVLKLTEKRIAEKILKVKLKRKCPN
jgi:hypothetical protein